MSSLLRRWQTESGDTYLVSLVRAIVGVMLLLSALREGHELVDGTYFGDVFHLPVVPEALVPGPGVFALLVIVELVLAVLVTLGRSARPALFWSAIVGTFILLCDRTRYHNNRYALLLFAFLLAFAPCDSAFVFRRGVARDRTGPLWAQRLAQLQLAIIYVASGGSKLLDPDWRSGLVIGDRLARSTALALSQGVPVGLVQLLSSPAMASGLSKLAITTELLLSVALFLPTTRFFALWWGVMFHATIEVTSKVELFGWLTLTIYVLFVTPTLRERAVLFDEGRPFGVFVARAVRALDWLVRFEVRADKAAAGGNAFVVVDRDGSTTAGLAAFARLSRAIPLLFPLSVPLFVIAAPAQRARLGTKPA
jgi:hypothetical protein